MIHNAIQCSAYFDDSNKDIWFLQDSRNPSTHMSDIIFRSIEMDFEELKNQNASLVFELTISILKTGDNKLTEMCCGWAELPIEHLDRASSHRLDIQGGSPMA